MCYSFHSLLILEYSFCDYQHLYVHVCPSNKKTQYLLILNTAEKSCIYNQFIANIILFKLNLYSRCKRTAHAYFKFCLNLFYLFGPHHKKSMHDDIFFFSSVYIFLKMSHKLVHFDALTAIIICLRSAQSLNKFILA